MLLTSTLWGQIRYDAMTSKMTINLNKRFPSINQQNTHGFGSTRGQNRASNTQYLVEKATLYFNRSVSIFITHPPESMRDLNRTFLTSTQINLNDKMLQTHINLF